MTKHNKGLIGKSILGAILVVSAAATGCGHATTSSPASAVETTPTGVRVNVADVRGGCANLSKTPDDGALIEKEMDAPCIGQSKGMNKELSVFSFIK